MFSGQSSPRKRKLSEFHDPDYHQTEQITCDESGGPESCIAKRQKQDTLGTLSVRRSEACVEKVRQIIEREFTSELAFKQKQLLEIDDRLEKARCILDKLRYSLVSDYYKKQDLPVAAVTTSAVRSAQFLFSREDKGPQMQIHPSLKKLIGKKPKDLSDVIRSCPKRTAAKNAVQTIRAKSEIQKKEERKLKQIIRGQGIVIDHSANDDQRTDISAFLNAAQSLKTDSPKQLSITQAEAGKGKLANALNSSRLNNKEKHLFVVGNTSKFIGAEQTMDLRHKPQLLTHKWLVYVQTKKSSTPLEKFVKKVRFHLHHSYRPNDVVDVLSPPFHVARRGWGEFPIRVQLFFHDEFNQKPIQLLHTVVLDKTLSGIQTLGAETLLEVWLKNISGNQPINKTGKTTTEIDLPSRTNRHCEVHPTEELVDDNLLEFLNKIEASQNSISADIEKIQPTFVISEAKVHKSPVKAISATKIGSPDKIQSKTQLENVIKSTVETNKDIKTKEIKHEHKNMSMLNDFKILMKEDIRTMETTNQQQQMVVPPLAANSTSIAVNCVPSQHKSSIFINNDVKISVPFNPVTSAVKRTILPVTNSVRNISASQSTPINSARPTNIQTKHSSVPAKQILQKKLVQLVDSTGKVKYMQMLVATSSSAPNKKTLESSPSIAPKLLTIPSAGVPTTSVSRPAVGPKNNPIPTMKPNIFKIVPENMQTKPQVVTFSTNAKTPTTTTITSTLSTTKITDQIQAIATKQNMISLKNMSKTNGGSSTKNVVFYKEGKLYIIDPLQMKLKQQQKKQVSLLKPQVSLLKQQFKQPQPKETTFSNMSTEKLTADHDYMPSLKTSVQVNSPQVHYGLKQQRLNTLNIFQLMQMKRVLFEKHVLRQQFSNMQNAVEFILRRLKLIAPEDSLVSAFPFVSKSNGDFQSLTAFKQRTHEWLRAKHISVLMRSHKDLQNINISNRETFWTTKEIATFARHYAYTPDIKSLPKINERTDNNCKNFKEIVKGELMHKETSINDTLSDCRKVIKWIDKVWPVLINYQRDEEENQIIDVDEIRQQNEISNGKSTTSSLELKINSGSKHIYLPPPSNLKNECRLITDICKDLSINLEHEEICPNLWYPSAQIVLAHSLNIFLQKIVRSALSLKHQEKCSFIDPIHIIQPSDIAKVLSKSREFDFMTNSNFGINAQVHMYSVKEEKL